MGKRRMLCVCIHLLQPGRDVWHDVLVESAVYRKFWPELHPSNVPRRAETAVKLAAGFGKRVPVNQGLPRSSALLSSTR